MAITTSFYPAMRKTTEQFILESKKLHPLYDYSLVNYTNNKTKVEIICDKGHHFWQTPNHHLRGQGCPQCLTITPTTQEGFIELAKQIHSNKYDYGLVKFVDANTPVEIICPKHGVFKQPPYYHIMGTDGKGGGCRKCKHDRMRLTNEEFVKRLKNKFGDEYDYSLVNYVDADTPVTLICKKHGVFERIPHHIFVFENGCTKCRWESTRLTQEEFIVKSKELNGERYDYSEVQYVNANTPVILTCDKGHRFEQKPLVHLYSRSGCPVCNAVGKSKSENQILNYLDRHKIEYDYQKKFDDLRYKASLFFDFYIPRMNMCIEYQGKQHYENVGWFGGEENFKERQIRDNLKREYCQSHNIRLVEIKYNDNLIKVLNNLFIRRNNYENKD